MAEGRVRRERFERNWAWFEAHAAEVYRNYRGTALADLSTGLGDLTAWEIRSLSINRFRRTALCKRFRRSVRGEME